MKKRILSIIMVLSMCLSMLPTAAFAAETDTGLCEHHTEHTEECGYAKAVAGMDCTHEHTADCYTNGVLPDGDADSASAYELEGDTEQLDTLLCAHTHDEDCYVTACVHAHDGECGYTEAVPCGHEHDDTCGYAPAVEEVLCDCAPADEGGEIVHTEDCGYVAPMEEQPCNHTAHDETCGYAEDAPCAHDCTEDTGCVTLSCAHVHDETCSSAGELACQHVHDDVCGYVEAVEASPCTYECALCGLTEITAWSWIDELEMLDPDTGVLALPGANERNPALFDDIVALLPVEINATVEGGEETIALDGWTCPGYPEEGAYSGNYIFTAALPEGYVLGLGTPELAVTVELGGAAVYADTIHNGLTISGGAEGTDFAFNREVLMEDGTMSASNSSYKQGIKILTSTKLTISGTLTAGGDYTGIYIPDGIIANLTLNGAAINGGYHTCPITVEGTLNLTLTGNNDVVPYTVTSNGVQSTSAGIWVLKNGNLVIGGDGSLNITTDIGNAAIGQTSLDTGSDKAAGSITINGGTLNITANGTAGGASSAIPGGAAIGAAGGNGKFTNITINGGVINATSASGAAIGTGATQYTSSGRIVINGGTINATGGNYGWAGSSLVADGIGGTQTLTGTVNNEQSGVFINGGSVNTNRVKNNRPTDGTNGLYLATITLVGASGGTAGTSATYYDANGVSQTYTVSGQTDTSGNIYLWLPEGTIVTKVTTGSSTNYYGSLLVTDDDLGAATFTSGTEVTLTVDTSITNAAVTFSNDSNTITASEGSMVFVKVEPIGSYAVDGVGISSSPTTYTHVTDNLYSVTMPSGGGTLYVSMAEVTVPEVLDLAKGQITFGYDSTNLRTVTYTDDNGVQTKTKIPASITYTIIQSDSGTDTTDNTITISNWKSGGQPLQLTIENLKIQVSTDVNAIDINNSNVELTLSGNSTITSSVSSQFQALVGVDGNSTLTFTEESGEASLSVNGAATCYNRGAAIGGDGNNGTEIPCGTINIKGGKIIANTNNAGAAIGSGLFGTGGIVNISGGTVKVTTAHNGAAIGSGQRGSATVIISDGTVEATTTKDGAAIGSGTNGSADVTITGGDIIATGSSDAPAIGSGYGSSTATVTITGGNINIEKNAATIGKSADAAATVTITGGSVNGTITSGVTATNNGGTPVYKITAALPDKDATVTGSITDGTYNFNGVKTNSEGKIFLWLPESSESDPTKATFNGGSYIGTVKTDNTGEFVSDKPSPTVTAPTANSRTYDGTEQVLVTAGSTTGGTLQYALGTDSTTIPGDENWSTTIPAGTDAKTYYVWYRVVGNDEYADMAATCVTVTIAQRTITVKADDQTVLVDGTPDTTKITVSGDGLVIGHTISVIFGTVDTSATGTKPLTIGSVTIKDAGDTDVTGNYAVTEESGTLTVSTHTHSWSYELTATNIITATCSSTLGSCPANNTVTITLTAPTADDLIYNGSPIEATATSSNEDELAAPTITYTATNGGTLTNDKPVNAGTYTASITVGGMTAQVTYTIAAKSIADATINLSASSGDYTGNAHAPTVTVNGLTKDTDYTVTFPADMTTGGAKTITVTGKGNYTGTQTLTYTINPIAPTAADFSFTEPDSLTYSGTAKAAIVAPATGITGMGAVTVKYSADPVNVGEYTVSIDVAAGDNYTAATDLTDSAWKFSITKAPLTITADNKSMLTGKDLPELTCSYSGFVNGETESVLTTQPSVTTATDGKTAGSFDITVSGAEAANYAISYVNGTLTVSDHVHDWTYTADDTANTITATCSAEGCPTPTQVITLAAPSGTLVYDGTAKEATVSGSIDGVTTPTVSYTGSLTEGKPINAGSYTASITVGGKSVSVDIVIGNASQTAPSVSAKNETIKGAADGSITGATEDMEYSTTSGGTYAAIPEKLAAGTYYVRYKAKTNYNASPDTTVTIAAGPAITVKFEMNGGTPAAADQTGLSYGDKVTKPADPTKTHYEFRGWYTDSNYATQWDFGANTLSAHPNLAAQTTLYAKWEQVEFEVTGTITGTAGSTYTDLKVELVAVGGASYPATLTSASNGDPQSWTYSDYAPKGHYNLIATAKTQFNGETVEVIVTKLEDLTSDMSNENLTLPNGQKNSVLDNSKAGDFQPIVGGLDTIAENTTDLGAADVVTIALAVTEHTESSAPTEDVTAIKEKISEDNNLKDGIVEYLDFLLTKQINDGNAVDIGGSNTQLLTIILAFDTQGKNNITVYRYHGGQAETLEKDPSAGSEGFTVGDGTITIYSKGFSTYAVAHTASHTITFDYNDGGTTANATAQTNSNGTVTLPANPTRTGYTFKGWFTATSGGTKVTNSYVFDGSKTVYAQWTQNNVNPGGGGGGGSYTPTYSVTVEDADNGSVKSDRTYASSGSTVTITVTPDEGYKLGGLTVTDANGKKIEVTNKGDGKYTFKMPGGKVTVEASFTPDLCDGGADCPSAKFIDIDPNAWYHEAIDYAIENGLMGGYGNGYFGPNDDLSRGMLAQILYNMEDRPAVTGDIPFTDVADGKYYVDAIKWAAQNGIVGGYGGGLFGPDDNITREQLAVMLWRYAGSPAATNKELNFSDKDEAGSWALDALIWAQENGVMQGNNGEVNPKGNATRAHVAQMLKNFLENIIK